MLLLACGSAAIGRSVRDRSAQFAASAHALTDALRQRALVVSTAAPPTYAAIEGMFGLASADEVGWGQVLQGPGFGLSLGLRVGVRLGAEVRVGGWHWAWGQRQALGLVSGLGLGLGQV